MSGVCKLLGFSRQAYYKYKIDRSKRHYELLEVRDLVMRIRSRMPRLGTRKLLYLLKDDLANLNIKLGRDVLFDFLRAEHLLVKPKRSYVKTTNSKHWLRKYPNLMPLTTIIRPEQVWVSDITYIKVNTGYEYLSLITDACSKRVMGYQLSPSLSVEGPMEALKMALRSRIHRGRLIHHSDRGLQYCASDYVEILESNKIKISMPQNGDPYENAIAERMNGILKYEFMIVEGFKDHRQALEAIKQSINIYNNERPHLSCNMLTPQIAHQQKRIKLKKWNKKPRKVTPEV